MSALESVKNETAAKIAAALGGDLAVSAVDFSRPPQAAMGDLSYGCFAAAKALKKSPADIAKDLAGKLATGGVVGAWRAAGPDLNIGLDQAAGGDGGLKGLLISP